MGNHELLGEVLAGTISPGRVFDLELPLEMSPRGTGRCTSGERQRCCCVPDHCGVGVGVAWAGFSRQERHSAAYEPPSATSS